jgi:cell wall assembly regulator SMI1
MNKKRRVTGTTEEAICRTETELKRQLPPSIRDWYLMNNGRYLEGVRILPIPDERDIPNTWDSIVRHNTEFWPDENFEDEDMEFDHLLPFAKFGTGDYYCFDYSQEQPDGEYPVVLWSHETGETEFRAHSFSDFEAKVQAGDFEYD